MARDYAIYMNGVNKGILDEMIECLNDLPEQVVYLQPYRETTIRELRDASPPVSDEERVLMVFSTMEDLTKVYYCAEVVRWEDKITIPKARKDKLDRLIRILQPNNCNRIYLTNNRDHDNDYKKGNPYCKNLISLRNVRRVEVPFDIGQMIKISGGKVEQRTQSGNFAYVHEKPKDGTALRTLLNAKP